MIKVYSPIKNNVVEIYVVEINIVEINHVSL
jgi:hypothetical protein